MSDGNDQVPVYAHKREGAFSLMLSAAKVFRSWDQLAGAQKSREYTLAPQQVSQISTVEARLNFANFTPLIPPIRVRIFSISRGFPLMMIASRQW